MKFLSQTARLLGALAVLFVAVPARATEPCASAYEESQVARSKGQLQAAQRQLRSCVRAECADFIRSDCARWLSEVESALPTVVFSAESRGAEVDDVAVAVDGEQLLTRLDGKAVPVDPGRRTFTFTFQREGNRVTSLEVVIREGEQNRVVVVQLQPAASAPTSPPPPRDLAQGRSSGWAPKVLLGLGALGIGGFATFGLLGQGQRSELEKSCEPRCDDSRIDAVRTKFLIADVSLGVGVLALAGSAYLFLASSGRAAPQARSAGVRGDLQLTQHGASAAAQWSF